MYCRNSVTTVKATLLLFLSLLAGQTSAATENSYPEKPVTLVVPYSTGGSADLLARLISKKMAEKLGQSIVVENKTGATGRIAEDYVSKSKPDGYTILYHTFPYLVNAPSRIRMNGGTDSLLPVAMLTKAAMILVVNSSFPAKTFREFMVYEKQHPKTASYASFGIGSPAHLAGELLDQSTNIRMLHVPYRGGGPAIIDVLGGHVDSYFSNVATALPYIRSGKLRGLAVSSSARISAFPDVPTVQESLGQPFDIIDWHGIFVPKGTPPEVVIKISAAAQYAMLNADVRKTIDELGVESVFIESNEFTKWLDSEIDKWSTLIRAKNIQIMD